MSAIGCLFQNCWKFHSNILDVFLLLCDTAHSNNLPSSVNGASGFENTFKTNTPPEWQLTAWGGTKTLKNVLNKFKCFFLQHMVLQKSNRTRMFPENSRLTDFLFCIISQLNQFLYNFEDVREQNKISCHTLKRSVTILCLQMALILFRESNPRNPHYLEKKG